MLIARITQMFARKLALVSMYVEKEDYLRYGFNSLTPIGI